MIKKCIICGEEFEAKRKDSEICYKEHFKKCIVCGSDFKITKKTIDKDTCSRKCTFIKNYGVDNPFRSEEIKSKIRNTNLEKYGVENVLQSQEFKNKIKETNLKKYGSENPMQSEEIKDKVRITNLKKYGVSHPMKLRETQDKSSKTVMKKYHVMNVFQSEEIKSKIRNTNLEKYGTTSPMKSDLIKEKTKNTCLRKYGNESFIGTEEYFEKTIATNLEKYGVPYHCMTDKCRKAGHIVSKINLQFQKFLKDNYDIDSELEFNLGNKSYDLHILGTKYLIEIDPTITHNSTFGFKSKDPMNFNYHFSKSKYANAFGFTCIHIFNWDDWNKVASLIEKKEKIYARDCEVRSIENKDLVNEFLNKNHLQGTCKGQMICYGLFYDNELVEIMTLGIPRYNKSYKYELLRLCTKSDKKIVGGSQRLFKHILEDNDDIESIISYCDYAKFNGEVYEKLGFKYESITNPRPVWSRGSDKITDNLLNQRGYDQLFGTSYGKGTSNKQLMIDNGWVQVFDCGQKIFIWNKE